MSVVELPSDSVLLKRFAVTVNASDPLAGSTAPLWFNYSVSRGGGSSGSGGGGGGDVNWFYGVDDQFGPTANVSVPVFTGSFTIGVVVTNRFLSSTACVDPSAAAASTTTLSVDQGGGDGHVECPTLWMARADNNVSAIDVLEAAVNATSGGGGGGSDTALLLLAGVGAVSDSNGSDPAVQQAVQDLLDNFLAYLNEGGTSVDGNNSTNTTGGTTGTPTAAQVEQNALLVAQFVNASTLLLQQQDENTSNALLDGLVAVGSSFEEQPRVADETLDIYLDAIDTFAGNGADVAACVS